MSRERHRERLLLELEGTVDPAAIELLGTLLISTISPSFAIKLVSVPEDGSVVRSYRPIPDGVGPILNILPSVPKPVIQFSLSSGTYARIVNLVMRCNDRLRVAGYAGTYNARLFGRFRYRSKEEYLTHPYTILSPQPEPLPVRQNSLWARLKPGSLNPRSLWSAQKGVPRPVHPGNNPCSSDVAQSRGAESHQHASALAMPSFLHQLPGSEDRSDKQMKTWDSLSDDSSEFHTAPTTPLDELSTDPFTPTSKPDIVTPAAPKARSAANDGPPIADISSGGATGTFRGYRSDRPWLDDVLTAEPEEMERTDSGYESTRSGDSAASDEPAELAHKQYFDLINAHANGEARHARYFPDGIEELLERLERQGRGWPEPEFRGGGHDDHPGNGGECNGHNGVARRPNLADGELGGELGGRRLVGQLGPGFGVAPAGREPVEWLVLSDQHGVRGGRAGNGFRDPVDGREFRGAGPRQAEAGLGAGGRAPPPPAFGWNQRSPQGGMRRMDVHGDPVGGRPPAPGPPEQHQYRTDLEAPYDVSRPIVVAPTPRDFVPAAHLIDGGASRAWEREQQHFNQADWDLMYALGMLPTYANPEEAAPPVSSPNPFLKFLDAVRHPNRQHKQDEPHDDPSIPTSFSASIDLGGRDILPGGHSLEFKRDDSAVEIKRDRWAQIVHTLTLGKYKPVDVDPQAVRHVEAEFWDRVARGEMGITRPECVRTPADLKEYAHYLNNVDNRIEMYTERGRYERPPEGHRWEHAEPAPAPSRYERPYWTPPRPVRQEPQGRGNATQRFVPYLESSYDCDDEGSDGAGCVRR